MYNQITANKRKTVFLMIIFIALILILGSFLGYANGNTYSGLFFALIISFFMNIFAYYKGDTIALKSSGAIEITKEENPYVWRMVENLCITAGLPMPRVHIIKDQAMNAFATGRDPEHASIAITQGLIDRLENEELEGVIAHELAHIKNYDIRIMTIVIVLIGVLLFLSDWLMRIHFFGSGEKSSGKSNPFFLIASIVLAILSPLIGQLIQLAISRKREFLADADGSLLTRYPEGLARALEKISKDTHTLQGVKSATAHLYISNPFTGDKKWISKFFSTHPPIEERIHALRNMN